MAVTVYKNAILFIVIFGCSGSLLLCQLSPVAASGGCSLLWRPGFSLPWLCSLWSMGSRVRKLQQQWHVGLVVAASGL